MNPSRLFPNAPSAFRAERKFNADSINHKARAEQITSGWVVAIYSGGFEAGYVVRYLIGGVL